MEGIGAQKRSPYHGIWVILLFSIGIPVGLFFLFKFVLGDISGDIFFATLVGSIFQFSLIIAGMWKEPFSAVVNRTKTFFEYVRIVKKKAFGVYWDSIKDDGVVFWIYLLILLANVIPCVIFAFPYFGSF